VAAIAFLVALALVLALLYGGYRMVRRGSRNIRRMLSRSESESLPERSSRNTRSR
jgi:flagellar biogenesis protein FliO